MGKRSDKKLSYWEVTSIGIGGMVGGGIFAVLGLSVELTNGGAPVAFLIAGIVALVTSYSYAKLSVAFPSQGGTVTFLDQAFGPGLLTGSANILLWIGYIVMLSVYAYAFGSYGASFFPKASQEFWKHILITASILGITGLNLFNARLIGKAEDWIVLLKLLILSLFIGVGIWGIDSARIAPASWSSPVSLIAGGMIIFLAYEGFELIANTAQDVRDAPKTLPRAFYSSVGFVIVLYILVAIVTVGSLPVDTIVEAKDYALAEAARPSLGQAGFVLIAIAAMLSTASAINATVYGAARLSYVIAKDGELPSILEKKTWGKPLDGLLITSGATLLIANLTELSSMSTMGSAGFLLIFAAVNGANLVLADDTRSSRLLSLIGIALCLGALGSLIWQTANDSPEQLWFLFAMVATAVFIELSFRIITGRKMNISKPRKTS
ncbi:amino acid permease-associated region [Thiorhodococcus drewsii AZ1]|uniref:Amino acid permease-associated region n=1 Tax=Thiorhodococcus drewsii AZ1 TaxID=765913 RepID=G2E116_9GAMM|nr:APC family permease [Thiorhodococcus drewsii]EGV31357.1 amino acid permease-associated region [Thiorhodococcus drewsii AZ1]